MIAFAVFVFPIDNGSSRLKTMRCKESNSIYHPCLPDISKQPQTCSAIKLTDQLPIKHTKYLAPDTPSFLSARIPYQHSFPRSSSP